MATKAFEANTRYIKNTTLKYNLHTLFPDQVARGNNKILRIKY